MSRTLVTAKVNPDIDGTASLLAYAHFLKEHGQDVEGLVFGSLQPETQYFIEKHDVFVPREFNNGENHWDNYILVDASSMKRMPKVVVADRVIEIIDHREGEPEKEFSRANIQNELIGAAATLVTERFMKDTIKPLPGHAKLLYGAIYHNSLNFTASNASPRDRHAAAFLEQEFGFKEQMIHEMFLYATDWINNNIEQALRDDAKEYDIGIPIRAYQLVVYGSEILNDKEIIEDRVAKLSQEVGARWSFLNMIDLEAKKSHIFCASLEGQKLLGSALGCVFKNNWVELEIAVLRKQIMPKLRMAVN